MQNMDKSKNNTKISGYLEKKGKNIMIGCYKNYWFVLEGGLLLYYRSKDEYDTISRIKGCINLGPPCNIKPLLSTARAFQIQTRTATITLRAANQEDQNRWMQAIMSEINPNKSQQKMSHFRYSLDELPQAKNGTELVGKYAASEEEPSPSDHLNDTIIQRLQKIGGQSYVNPAIGTIGKAAARRRDKDLASQESPEKGTDGLRNMKENPESIKRESSENRPDSESLENLYERNPVNLTDNDNHEVPVLPNIKKSMSLPRRIQSTFRIRPAQNRPVTLTMENDTYECIVDKGSKQTFQSLANKNKETWNDQKDENNSSHLVHNDLYASTTKTDDKTTGSNKTVEVVDDQSGIPDKVKTVLVKYTPKSNTPFFSNKENKQSSGGNENKQMARYSQIDENTPPTTTSTYHDSNKTESILMENDIYGCAVKGRRTNNVSENSSPKICASFFSDEKGKSLFYIDEREENSISSSNNVENHNRSTLLEENEIYGSAAEVNEKLRHIGENGKFTIENELYAHPVKERKLITDKDAVTKNDRYSQTIYTEVDVARDHNENDVINEIYSLRNDEENLYSMPHQYADENTEEAGIEAEYVEYAEPQFEGANKNKKKTSPMKPNKTKEETNKASSKSHPKLKKTSSFIRKVWKRKAKHKEKTDDEHIVENPDNEHIAENLYETVPEVVVEKLTVTDGQTVQMLSELQNILERKKPILIQKLPNDGASPTSPMDFEASPITTNDSGKMEHVSFAQKEEQLGSKKAPENPLSPIETQSSQNPSPSHDIPKNNQPVGPPPRRVHQYESIDEILDDLDNENNNTNKVKSLIKRFSESDVYAGDVVLRTNRKPRESIDSDELSRLLEELAEVTNAPILTPGVTSSLNGSNIENLEFSKLLPDRRRRYSDPDYDIPRPHKSLTILPKTEGISENVIGSTRFFGPILKPSDMEVAFNRSSSEALFRLNSITPDSLEGNDTLIPLSPLRLTVEADSACGSHHYYKFIDRRTFLNMEPSTASNSKKNCSASSSGSDMMIENDIYVDPKLIRFNLKSEHIEDRRYGQDLDAAEDDEEVFIDSLENDNSTANGVYTALRHNIFSE